MSSALQPEPRAAQPPVITSATSAGGRVGKLFSYRIKATNHPTSFGATGLPAGLSLDASTGIISGTPAAAGTPSIQISATNVAGTGTATLTMAVKPAPQPPVITSATSAGGKAGKPFSYRIKATGRPTSFGATGLPAGLSLDASTGIISGTPTEPGFFSVHLSATNAAGTGTATLTLTFKVGPLPVITSFASAEGKVGKPFSYRIKATNHPTSFGATGLPPGLSVNPSTGVISGTPAGAGTFNIQLSATNSAGTGTATLALTVTTPISGEAPAFVAPSAQAPHAGFQPAWVPPPASPTPPPVPPAPPPAAAQPTLADLGRQLQEIGHQLLALQAGFQPAWVPPPASPTPPPVPPAPPPAAAQPTLADLGRQFQEMSPQLLGGPDGSRRTGIVAASGIVMQGLLTIVAMTEETGHPNGGGSSRP